MPLKASWPISSSWAIGLGWKPVSLAESQPALTSAGTDTSSYFFSSFLVKLAGSDIFVPCTNPVVSLALASESNT